MRVYAVHLRHYMQHRQGSMQVLIEADTSTRIPFMVSTQTTVFAACRALKYHDPEKKCTHLFEQGASEKNA